MLVMVVEVPTLDKSYQILPLELTTSSTATTGAGPEKKGELAIQWDSEEEEEERDVTQQGQIRDGVE